MDAVKSTISRKAIPHATFPFAFDVIAENNWKDTETVVDETETAAAGQVRAAHPDALLIRRVRD